jgi:hypothetical protein
VTTTPECDIEIDDATTAATFSIDEFTAALAPAWEGLRRFVGAARTAPRPFTFGGASRPSIYEFAGGEDAFLALAAAHHERCLNDPALNHPFSHPGHPDHIHRLGHY